MNRALILFFTGIVITIDLFSQSHLLFKENFDDNHRHWLVTDDKESSCKVENGKYVMQSKLSEGTISFYTPYIYFDYNKDFIIETNIIHTDGPNNTAYGVMWGAADINNGYNFEITSDGRFKVTMRKNGDYTELKSFESTKAIKAFPSSNSLRIEKHGNELVFSINGIKVYNTAFMPFLGDLFGWVLDSKVTISADDFTIMQDAQIKLVAGLPTGLQKENLGPNINSLHDEVIPVISADGKTLYFSVEGNPLNTGGEEDPDEIYFSTLQQDGKWSPKIQAAKPLNNEGPNFVISVTPDNNRLLLANTYKSNGMPKSAGFSFSEKKQKGWSVPEDLKIKNFYNLEEKVSSCLSADGKVLVMSVQRNECYGRLDLYVSFKNLDGSWSEPINMGKDINTRGEEISPFLAADGKTLYFSSNGFPGYGDNDIFMSTRLDNSWTKWSEPLNLGNDINSSDWDAYYSVPASGDFAYVVSHNNSLGGADIFKVKLPETLKPKGVVMVYGKVLNSKTKEPVSAKIEYEIFPEGTDAGSASSNAGTGDYKIILPCGSNYGYHAIGNGYMAISENLDLTKDTTYQEIHKDLLLVPIEVGQTLTLQNVFFERSTPNLLPMSYPELDRLYELLAANKTMEIHLSGHTDNQGDEKKNMVLSEDRVKAVKEYLVSKGIQSSRISGKGYGSSRPVASNSTEETRKLNRRVEFTITKK